MLCSASLPAPRPLTVWIAGPVLDSPGCNREEPSPITGWGLPPRVAANPPVVRRERSSCSWAAEMSTTNTRTTFTPYPAWESVL